MKTNLKRILSLTLALAIIMMLPYAQVEVTASSTYSINGVNVSWDDYSPSAPDDCWAYANKFYKKIWGTNFTNSFSDTNNSLRNLADSELTLTEENLKKYVTNAALGSCLRICNSDYLHGNDGMGHSQIIVQKDTNGFTVFEGGLSAYPYCREQYFTWNDYINRGYLGGKYSYIKYIKWPNAPAYTSCTHPSYNSLGVCTSCGHVFDWESTRSLSSMGIYTVTKSFTPRTDKPYDTAEKAGFDIPAGETVEVIGEYENAHLNKWYKFVYNGQIGYVYRSYLEFSHYGQLKAQCTNFSTDGQKISGTVTSNYPLAVIYAYVDYNQYASWKAGNKSTTEIDLNKTDINYELDFSSLADGEHTIELIAHSFVHDYSVYCLSTQFYVGEDIESKRPGKPALKWMKSSYLEDETVTFYWDETENTTHYNLWLLRKTEDDTWVNEERIFYAENGLERTFAPGEYKAQLLSYNSNAAEPDGSDWLHTWADNFYFTVYSGECTVTFDPKGGECSQTSKTVYQGTEIGELPEALKEGYDFAGWYLALDCNEDPVTSTFEVSENVTFYARWANKVYDGNHVTFDVNGGTLPGVKTTFDLNGINVWRRQYQMVVYSYSDELVNTNRWGVEVAVNADGQVISKREYEDENQLTVPQNGFVLSGSSYWDYAGELVANISVGEYVAYDENAMKVYVYADQDAYLAAHKYVPSNSCYGMLPIATQPDSNFIGWYTEADGGTEITENSIYSVSTLYAHWRCAHNDLKTVNYSAPGCETTGNNAFYLCMSCGQALKADGITETTEEAEILLQTGHSYSYVATKQPTTSVTGTLTGTCSKCKGTTTVTLPKLTTTDYTYAVKTAATCTADGTSTYTWKTTTYGNFSFSVTLTKTGHSYDNGRVTVVATCTQNGVKTHTCSSCGNAYTESIAPTGHRYQYGVCITCGAGEPNATTLSGTVTSFGNSTDPVTMGIYVKNSDNALRTLTIKNGSFMIMGLPAGEYRLTFSKQNHVTREYAVILEGGETVVDAKICLLGDVTGDGRVNVGDTAKLYSHIRQTALLTDEYQLLCANVNGGSLDVGDVANIYSHNKGTKKLY